MFSLEPEIERLRGVMGDAATDTLVARERREVFSVHPEVRIAGWGGAVLLAAAAGIVLKDHIDRVGPVVLAAGIGVIAALCYAWTWWRRGRAGLVDDYILLLGALLVSADVAFIETQLDVFGDAWPRHFLLLAVIHGAAAYLYRSRMVLSLSIAALAAWIGVEQGHLASGRVDEVELAIRAFACAALILAWREIDWRMTSRRSEPGGLVREYPRTTEFSSVFEHFATNLALIGGLALVTQRDTRMIGLVITLFVAALAIVWGFRTRRESFVLYAFVYAVIAIDITLVSTVGRNSPSATLFILTASMIAAVIALFNIHSRFREGER